MSVAGNDDALLRDLRELTDELAADAVVGPLTGRLAVLVSAAVDLLGVESVGLSLLDDADQVRTVAYTGHAAKVLELAQEHTLVGPGIDVLTDRITVTVEDLADDPRYGRLRQEVTDGGIRAVLAVPVRLDGQVVGNLNAVVPTPHVWSATQKRAAEALAAVVGQLLLLAAQADPHATGGNGRGPAG